MKIFLHVNGLYPLHLTEALNFAFALASFEHHIQLFLDDRCITHLLSHPDDKIVRMLDSLPLYEMPPALVDIKHQNSCATQNVLCINALKFVDDPMQYLHNHPDAYSIAL